VAARLREGLAQFNVQLGSWHDEPVGPHPKSMYQVAFMPDEFGKIIPWLMLNREGLDVLVHPSTGNSAGDHLKNSLWLGEKLKLKIEALD
jgi:DOPA 4,5-dioxygenase